MLRLAAVLALLLSALPARPAEAELTPTRYSAEPFAGQVSVKLREAPDHARVMSLQAGLGLELVRHNEWTGVSTFASPDPAVVDQLRSNPLVEWAEPVRWRKLAVVPNDTHYAMHQQWYYDLIGAPAAWDVETGKSTVTIAIIDSGVMCTHPELSGKLWRNTGETAGNGLDDDGNGYVDDVNGFDFVGAETGAFPGSNLAGDGDPCVRAGDPAVGNGLDDDFDGLADAGVTHGTMVAGIAAASGNNGQGVAGVCWGCTIMPLRVANPEGWVRSSDVADAISYATRNGAKVINLSLGGPNISAAEQAAIDQAVSLGVSVVAAAGNENAGLVSYPARLTNVIAVGASDHSDPLGRAPFSNWGGPLTARRVDVVAPGVDLISTGVLSQADQAAGIGSAGSGGYFSRLAGTSFSAPLVSGLVGLMRSRTPTLTPVEVHAILQRTAVNLPDDSGDSPDAGGSWDGWGMVSAPGALAQAPFAQLLVSVDPTFGPSETSFRLTGAGFPGNKELTVYLDFLGGTGTGVGLCSGRTIGTFNSGSGSFTFFGTVPACAATGAHTLLVADGGTVLARVGFIVGTAIAAPPSSGGGSSGGGGGGGGSPRPTPTPPPAPPTVTNQTVNTSTGGTVSLGESVSVQFPAGAVVSGTGTADVSLEAVSVMGEGTATVVTTVQTAPFPEGSIFGSAAFTFSLKDGAGNPLTLAQSVLVSAKYNVSDLDKAGGNATLVRLMAFDPASRRWTDFTAYKDPLKLTIYGSSKQTGLFAVVVELPTPVVTGPEPGALSADLAPLLSWTNPAGVTQVHIQVIPHNNDGPGINLIRNVDSSYQVEAPLFGVGNYVMLPGMSYAWRVRSSTSAAGLGENDPGWSGWVSGTFKTTPPSSSISGIVGPIPGSEVANRTPTLTWSNSDKKVFYYEVQVSKDPAFGSGSFLYWELRHGAVSTPQNSYRIPDAFPLEAGTAYHWRVRPRVQGDGAPVGWSAVWRFRTPP